MHPSPGRIASVAIVSGWLALVAIHLTRSYSAEDAKRLTHFSGSAETELTQRGVFYRGARIGFLRERVTPEAGGFSAEQSGEFTLNLMGRERKMSIEGSAKVGSTGELVSFAFRLQTSSRRSPFETRVEGRVRGNELVMTIRSGETEREERRPLTEPIVLPLNLYYTLAAQNLEVGQSYRLRLFDPMTLSDGDALVEVKELEIVRWSGHEEEALRLETSFAGLTTTAWVNERGEVLKEETPLGWTLLKEAPGTTLLALGGGGAEPAPDVLMQSAVPAIGFAGAGEALREVRMRLNGFPQTFHDIQGGRQQLEENFLRITRESPPYLGDDALSPEARDAALASDVFIQADDPRIRETALEVVNGADALEGAKALSSWVHENLTKSPTLSVPSAREILEQRVGDCNEHTVLFTALARSVQIPTRMSTGLAYSGGQFYYHSWPEVWVGRWLALDPTFGQFPADPLHLRLTIGGLESQFEVLNLMGRGASIEILETK